MINNETSLTAKIKGSQIETVIATGEKFIDVEVEFYADGEIYRTMRFGYPIGTPVEQIKGEISQALANLKTEAVNQVANEEAEKVEQTAQDTVNQLADLEINEQ